MSRSRHSSWLLISPLMCGGKALPYSGVKLRLRSMIRCSLLVTDAIMLSKLRIEFFSVL